LIDRNAELVVAAGTAKLGKATGKSGSKNKLPERSDNLRAHFGFRPVSDLNRPKAPGSASLNSRGVLLDAMTSRIRLTQPLRSSAA